MPEPAPTAPALTQAEQKSAEELIYELAADPQERTTLDQFDLKNDFDQIQEWFVTSGLPVTQAAQKIYHKLAQQAIQQIPTLH